MKSEEGEGHLVEQWGASAEQLGQLVVLVECYGHLMCSGKLLHGLGADPCCED